MLRSANIGRKVDNWGIAPSKASPYRPTSIVDDKWDVVEGYSISHWRCADMRELVMKLWLEAGKTRAEVWKSLKGRLSSDYAVVIMSLVTEEHDHCHRTMVNV